MRTFHSLLCAALLALTACADSHRPTYSGHEESTEGVPGFDRGKKRSPYVKLGQSYTVDGETHVPRFQPDYREEGLASWYGPGFHGGKTANGEVFDKHALTAAHRTLPLPSMVRVTMLSTGKSTLVRINDRGPFSKKRLIDLSYGAAQELGLIGKGVDRVRVEYLPEETEKLVELMAQGRAPDEIDIANDVVAPVSQTKRTALASNQAKPKNAQWWKNMNPISTAHAEELPPRPSPESAYQVGSSDHDEMEVEDRLSAPQDEIVTRDLEMPVANSVPTKPSTKSALPSKATATNSKPLPFGTPSKPLAPEERAEPGDAEGIEAAVLSDVGAEAPLDTDTIAAPTPAPLAPEPPPVTPASSAETPKPTETVKPMENAVQTPPPPVEETLEGSEPSGHYLQLGAFVKKANALSLKQKAASLGSAVIDTKTDSSGVLLYRVRMGPFSDVDESARMLAKLHVMGIDAKEVP